MASTPPHIHTASDSRFRVWDGERFVAIYEPDDYASAAAHLQRLQGKTRRRTAEPAPREIVLDLSSIAAARRGATEINAEDPERVHLKQFSDGWRVWNPLSRSYVGAADRGAFAAKSDAMFRARELAAQAGLARRGAPSKAMARKAASVEGGGLFAAREMAAPGQQVGFKFNGRKARAVTPVAIFSDAVFTSVVVRSPRGGFDVSLVETDTGQVVSQGIHYADLAEALNKAARGAFGKDVSVVKAQGYKLNQRLQGRRGVQSENMPLYADVMAIGRAVSADDLPPRRSRVEAASALRPNGGRNARKRRSAR